MTGLLLIDAANVVGSVPDGWWRDRLGATVRLRDALVHIAEHGLTDAAGPEWLRQGPIEVLLVVEGAAKATPPTATVGVLVATGSGDDAIVAAVAAASPTRRCAVATADRGLRSRVTALGAHVIGPRTVRP